MAAVVSWDGGTLALLSKLAGHQVQLWVVLVDGKLFAIRLAWSGEQ